MGIRFLPSLENAKLSIIDLKYFGDVFGCSVLERAGWHDNSVCSYWNDSRFRSGRFTGRRYVHALFADGAAMRGGIYTSSNDAWISGPGTLVVTYPPVGMGLQMK